jgi:hypothetical protein
LKKEKALPFKLSEFFKIKFINRKNFKGCEINMDKDAVKEAFLEKSAGMKKAELGAYIVALKISIITDIPQKVQENTSAVNVENILMTLLELYIARRLLWRE